MSLSWYDLIVVLEYIYEVYVNTYATEWLQVVNYDIL